MSSDKPIVVGQDTAGRVYNFDPKTVQCVINGVPISGFAEGSFIEVDRDDAAPPYWRMPPGKKWHDYDEAIARAEMTVRKHGCRIMRRGSRGWRMVRRALEARDKRIRREEERRWRVENFVNADRLGTVNLTLLQEGT